MIDKGQGRWDAMQRDRDGGASVAELAAKYNVSKEVIYFHTRANGKKTAGQKRKTPRSAGAAPHGAHADGSGRVTLEISGELADAIWSALTLPRKVQLLQRLNEVE
ncbi:MAG: hypothetical protein ACLP1Y_09020, partial [Candidatus Acidiferrales bacterium]